MHRVQYTLNRQDVYEHFAQLLFGQLRLRDYKRKCTAGCLVRILATAAAQRASIEGVCKLLYAPSGETVRKAIKANLPDAEELEKRINQALAADVPSALQQKRQQLALDLVLIPYHGQPHENPDEVVRGQPKQGTTHFHAYGTVSVIRSGRRFTLALTWVHQSEGLAGVVQRLLRRVFTLGIRPKRLLLDRGFFTVPVIRYLQTARIPFLTAMPVRGRKATASKPAGATRALCQGRKSYWTTYRWRDHQNRQATVSVAAVHCPMRAVQHKQHRSGKSRRRRRDVPFELYAYGGWQPKTLDSIRTIYRRRFGIESGYRQMNQARIRTCTANPLVRLFYVGVALVLRNVWVWLHYAVLSGRQRGGRTFHWECLRLMALLSWIRQLSETFFGMRSMVVTERSPPQPFRRTA